MSKTLFAGTERVTGGSSHGLSISLTSNKYVNGSYKSPGAIEVIVRVKVTTLKWREMSLVLTVKNPDEIVVNLVSMIESTATTACVSTKETPSAGGFRLVEKRQSLFSTPVNGIIIGTAGSLM